MQLFIVCCLAIINLVIVGIYFYVFRNRQLWLLPLTIFIPQYLLNYVYRASVLLGDGTWSPFSNTDVLLALLYATLFMAIHVTVLILLLCRVTFARHQEATPLTAAFPSLSLIIPFCVIVLELFFRIGTGNFRSIVQEFDIYAAPSIVDRVTHAFGPLRWYLIGAALIVLTSGYRRILAITVLATTIGFSALSAFIATSKGMMANCILAYFIWTSVAHRKASKVAVGLALGLFIVFGIFSYIARFVDYKLGRIDNVFDYVSHTVNVVLSERTKQQDRAWESVMGRFSYLDGLAGMIKQGDQLNKGVFALGSISEWPNVVPRFIMPEKRLLVFERHLTLAVYGAYSPNAAMPVGRIGESYFVVGWFGLIYAPILAWVLWALFHYLYFTQRAVVFRAYYVMLLLSTLNHDGALLANFSSNVYVFVFVWFSHWAGTFLSGGYRDVGVPLESEHTIVR